jgi:hypothetical protein
VSIGAHQLLFVRGSAPGRVAIRIFFFFLDRSEERTRGPPRTCKGRSDTSAHREDPLSFLLSRIFFSFSFTSNLPFFDRGLGEGPLICVL